MCDRARCCGSRRRRRASASTASARSAATSPQNAPGTASASCCTSRRAPGTGTSRRRSRRRPAASQDRDVQVRIEFAQDLSPQIHRRQAQGTRQRVRSRRRRRGGASAGLPGGRRPEAARRAGVRADLAAFGKRQRPLCRSRQLEGRTHLRLGDRQHLQGARQARHSRRQPSLSLPGNERERLPLLFPGIRARVHACWSRFRPTRPARSHRR